MYLEGKHILLGISGSIAAYKTPELIRIFQKEGATVQVMATRSALRFVTPLTLETLSGYPLLEDFSGVDTKHDGKPMKHIHSSRQADLVVIAPATADILAKFAHGFADNIVTTTVLGSQAPVLIAPAMNVQMWKNPLVQENIKKLSPMYHFVMPEEGFLACGEYGEGRLADLSVVLEEVIRLVTPQDLKDKKILITAGSTREFLDPVRFLSNASSGKMALALAREAYHRGAHLTIVKGFTEVSFDNLATLGIKLLPVISAGEMVDQTLKLIAQTDIFLCPAAIADYQPAQVFSSKIKKNGEKFVGDFIPTPDLLERVAKLKKRPFVVGFALENSLDLKFGNTKLKRKKMDMLVLNGIETLGSELIQASLLQNLGVLKLPPIPKESLSKNIFTEIVKRI